MEDQNNQGGSQDNDACEAYDSAHGKWKCNVSREEGSQEGQLGTAAMPKAPDPNPFKMGPMGSGGR